MTDEGVKTVVAAVRDAEGRMRERDEAVQKFLDEFAAKVKVGRRLGKPTMQAMQRRYLARKP